MNRNDETFDKQLDRTIDGIRDEIVNPATADEVVM